MHIKVNWLNEENMPKFHFLLLWLLMRSSPASSIDPKRFYQPGNVTLGVLLPLHVRTAQDKCGEFYAFGLGYAEAITFAIERINKDPELLPNVTLGFDIRDYCDTPVLAMKIANDFVKSNYLNELLQEQGVKELRSKLKINMDYLTAPVSAVIGTGDSGSTTLVSSLLHVAAIPTISPFATSEELSSPYFNSFFRTIPPDGQQAKAMVDIIEYYQWKYIAAVAVDHSYGRYGLRALEREAYDRKTFCIAFSEYITPSGYKGKIITSIVRKLKDAENIKVVVLWSTYEPAKRFLEEATAQGLEGRTFLISEALTSMNPDVLGKNAVILKGAIGIRPYLFTDRLFEDYLKGITLNKTRESANPWWKEFWTSHLNCTSTSEGSCLNRSKIDARAFAKLHDAFVPYLTDAVYALAHALDSLPKCKEPGGGPLASGYCPEQNANIKHEAMLLKLRKVSFQGITGQVQFTESGDPTFSSYDIVNFQKQAENYENVKVGTWTGGSRINLTINDKQIIWANEESEPPISTCSHRCPPGTKQTITVSCCWECIKCPLGSISKQHSSPNCTKCPQLHKSNAGGTACLPLPVINIKWSDGTAVVFLILTVIGLLVTSVAFFIFMKNQSTPLVRASNRELSLLLLVAVALCFVLTLLHLAQPTKMLCCIVYPLRYFINTTFVSILFLKTNRLVRAFQTDIIPNWFKRYILDRKRQFLVVLGLNIVEVILAVLWLTLDPPYEHQEIRVQTHVFYTCMPFRSAVGRILRATMFSYFIFLSLVCAGYAFKARRLPENFNETRYIGLALYVLLISWMSFYPVDTSLEGFYTTIVACATALVTAYGILLCVFAPKLFVILLHPEQNTNEFMKDEIGQFTRSSTFSGRIQRAKVQPTNGIKNNCT